MDRINQLLQSDDPESIALGVEYMKMNIPEPLWDIYLMDKLNSKYSWSRNGNDYKLKERFEKYEFVWTSTSFDLYESTESTTHTFTTYYDGSLVSPIKNLENYINKIYEEKSELPTG